MTDDPHAITSQRRSRSTILLILVLSALILVAVVLVDEGALRSRNDSENVLPTGISGANDSPITGMLRGNAARTGEFAGAGPVASPVVDWRVLEGACRDCSPVATDEIVIIQSPGVNTEILGIDTKSGDIVWRHPVATIWGGAAAIADGIVYARGHDGRLLAFDAATGIERWSSSIRPGLSDPVVAGDRVFIITDGILHAAAISSGDPLWEVNIDDRGTDLVSTASSSPAVANGLVYAGSWDHHLYAVDEQTGEIRWRYDTREEIWSSPVVTAGTVYIHSSSGLHALDAVTGQPRWHIPISDSLGSSPAVVNGVIYAASSAGTHPALHALDAETGRELWAFETNGWIPGSPAVSGGIVYVGSVGGNLYAIDTVTGHERWHFEADGAIFSSPVIANGVLYFTDEGGTLYAITGEGTRQQSPVGQRATGTSSRHRIH